MTNLTYLHVYGNEVEEQRTGNYDIQTSVGAFLDDATLRQVAINKYIELDDGSIVRAAYQGNIWRDDGDDYSVIKTFASNGLCELLHPHFKLFIELGDPDDIESEAKQHGETIREMRTKYVDTNAD